MTWHSWLYNGLLMLTVGYGMGRGGWPERSAIILWIVSNAASAWTLARSSARFVHPEIGLFVVDLVTFLGFVAIALTANRRWPMFATGMIGCEVAVHLCKFANPRMLPLGYSLGVMVWGYAILFAILLGTWRQRRLPRAF